jgi:AsmA protein
MKILKIVGIVVAILLVVLIALPFLINVNSFRPKIESELSDALGRQVTVGNLSLSLLSGSVKAENIAVADDPKFSKTPFVTAKSLKIGVEMMPLIFSKQLNITGITLEEPQITVLKTPSGTWNYSSLGGTNKQKVPSDKTSSTPKNVSVAKLNIENGKLIVGKANSTAKPTVYDKVNIEITDFSPTSQFPFKLTAALPGGGDVSITGKAGPINNDDTSKTPFETAVKVNNMNIQASGFVDKATGIAGLANFDGTLSSNGSQAKAVGLFTGSKMVFSPKGSPAPKNITIKHTVNVDLDKQLMTIAQGDVGIGSTQAHLTGTVASQGETQNANLKLNAPGMSVDELEAMLPSFGVILPQGSQLKGGTLSTELTIVGPVNNLVVTGPVKLANTKLANFDLGQKLGALSTFAGKAVSNPDTSIQNFSLDARQSNAGTQASNINLTVPAIGVITGAGTVSPAGALAFKMLANLHGGMAGGLTEVAALGSGKNGIPFAIEGTTSNPKFIPDVKGIVGGVAQGALGQALGGAGATKGVPPEAINALGGLLGGKKKK